MEACSYSKLCRVMLVFLVYQEICTFKYLQNKITGCVCGGVDLTLRKQITSLDGFIPAQTISDLGLCRTLAQCLISKWP